MILFYSYSHKDEALRDELEVHLSILKRQGTIDSWHDRRIQPGSDWKQVIEDRLHTADIFLLLVSADFLASDYCYGWEVETALQRDASGEAIVIPVILRACDWHASPWARLQALPKDGKPVTSWANRDEAWTDVARGIRRTVSDFTTSYKPIRASAPRKKDAPAPVQSTALPEEVPRRELIASQDDARSGLAFELGRAPGNSLGPRREPVASQDGVKTGMVFGLGKALGNFSRKIFEPSNNNNLVRVLFGSWKDWIALAQALCVLGFIASVIAFIVGLVSVSAGEKGGDVIGGGFICSIFFLVTFYFIKNRLAGVRERAGQDAQAD